VPGQHLARGVASCLVDEVVDDVGSGLVDNVLELGLGVPRMDDVRLELRELFSGLAVDQLDVSLEADPSGPEPDKGT